jgi:hypothetical protein
MAKPPPLRLCFSRRPGPSPAPSRSRSFNIFYIIYLLARSLSISDFDYFTRAGLALEVRNPSHPPSPAAPYLRIPSPLPHEANIGGGALQINDLNLITNDQAPAEFIPNPVPASRTHVCPAVLAADHRKSLSLDIPVYRYSIWRTQDSVYNVHVRSQKEQHSNQSTLAFFSPTTWALDCRHSEIIEDDSIGAAKQPSSNQLVLVIQHTSSEQRSPR